MPALGQQFENAQVEAMYPQISTVNKLICYENTYQIQNLFVLSSKKVYI